MVLLRIQMNKRVRARRGNAKPLGVGNSLTLSREDVAMAPPGSSPPQKTVPISGFSFETKGQSDASIQIKISLLTWAALPTSVHLCSPHSYLWKMRRQIYWQVVMKYFLPKSNILCMTQIYLYSLKIKINTSVCGMAVGSYRVCLHNEETIKCGESFLHSENVCVSGGGWWSQGFGRGHCKAKVKSVIFCGLSV